MTATDTHVSTVHFLTLGCPKNEVDTERMQALVATSRYAEATDPDDADIVILNTCGFIEDAVVESVENALDILDWRNAAPNRHFILTGCMVSRYGDDLASELAEVDAFLPVADEASIIEVLDDLTGRAATAPTAPSTPLRVPGAISTYLQVADGCHRSCAFCTIPSIRGDYVSKPFDDITREAAFLAGHGTRELVLIGQDISAWGRDLPREERALPDIVTALAALPELAWLRLMYVQPSGVTDALLEAMAASETVVEYLDMPLQHASPEILRSMERAGSAEEFLALIERIRDAMPHMALRTTLIAGFPGETDAHVQELATFLEAARFDYAGVFPYSPEDGTPAAELSGLPSAEERLARAQHIRDVADRIALAKLEERVGTTLQVLAEGLDEEGAPIARWRGQAPEVDGYVFLDRELAPGTIADAHITTALGYDLEGQVL